MRRLLLILTLLLTLLIITLRSQVAHLWARNAAAPLAQTASGNTLTLAKSVNWNGNIANPGQTFAVNVVGPNGYATTATLVDGQSQTLANLAGGVYTITESSPGLGWSTTYTATPGIGSASQAVVNLQSAIPVTTFLPSGNLALGRTAIQSANFVATTPADLAIDGNTDGALANNSVAVAQIAANAWWQIDLGNVYNLTNIVLWSRTDGFHSQASNLRVFVSDVPFTSTDYNTTLAQAGVSNYPLVTAVPGSNPLIINRSGRHIRVQLTGTNYLSLAEVQIFSQAISGVIFRDFNSNGQFDQTATLTEVGLANVTVTVYNSSGVALGSTVTSASGGYAIPLAVPGPYRVEFSNLPAGYAASFHGTNNNQRISGTSTQFVTTSTGGTVNFGVNQPCDYCQTSPQLATTEMTFGDPLLAPPSTQAALIRFNYDSPGAITTDANLTQLGAAWGLAYGRTTRLLYVGAFQRRFTGYGPLGTGGIYYFNRNTNTLVNWLDLNTLAGVDTGSDPHTTLPAVGGGTPVRDPASYDAVGKIGLGDIDLSTDESTLWAINLNQRTLLEIPLVGNPPAVPTSLKAHDLTNVVTCTNGVFRPWGLKFYNGQIYVGGVCSGENGGTQSNLTAHVLVHDPLGAVGSFSQVFSLPLNYAKGCSLNFGGLIDCNGWNIWQTTWPSSFDPGGGGYTAKTQPILSDIEFDLDGSLILGFTDRWGYQAGNANYQPNAPDAALYSGTTGGDTLRICLVGGNYVAEGGVGCPQLNNDNIPSAPQKQEFYQDAGGGGLHPEAALGALAFLPGRGEVVSTKLDPQSVFAVGATWLNNTTGLTRQDFNTMGNPYNKASAIGDIELLCDPAPLEIGNRVWHDINSNGIQDPGEPGMNGLTVSLQSPTNTVTTLTSGDGNYYFTVRPATAYTVSLPVPTGYSLTPANTQTLPCTDSVQAAGVQATLCLNHPISDTRDSDAVLISSPGGGQVGAIIYTTGSAGQNNHGLDIGFIQPVSAAVQIFNQAPLPTPTPTNTPVPTPTNTPQPATFTLSKELDGAPQPFGAGQFLTFTIHISNTGPAVITQLAISDTYPIAYLYYRTASLAPASDLNDGQLDWPNIAGAGIAPGTGVTLRTTFMATQDTTALPGGLAVNRVAATSAQANGGSITLPAKSSASVLILDPTGLLISQTQALYTPFPLEQVQLTWSSLSEASTVGYKLERLDLLTNETVILADFIAAQRPGSPQGATYHYTDATTQANHAYRYRVATLREGRAPVYDLVGIVYTGPSIYLPQIRQ